MKEYFKFLRKTKNYVIKAIIKTIQDISIPDWGEEDYEKKIFWHSYYKFHALFVDGKW